MKRAKNYSREKFAKASKALKFSFDGVTQDGNIETAGEEMIRQLKEKYALCKKASDKIMILSVLPQSWSSAKIRSLFN